MQPAPGAQLFDESWLHETLPWCAAVTLRRFVIERHFVARHCERRSEIERHSVVRRSEIERRYERRSEIERRSEVSLFCVRADAFLSSMWVLVCGWEEKLRCIFKRGAQCSTPCPP